jgi:2-keto-4-pentenoate hydratase/2-oxohepta-3-ene-1,7-dioic acid hydratase in catechol pathway
MKFVTHRDDKGSRLGVVSGERLHNLPFGAALTDLLADPDQLHVLGQEAQRQTDDSIIADDAIVEAPLQPHSIRDFSVFPQHMQAMGQRRGQKKLGPEFWELPIFYFSNPWAVTGPFDDVPIPPGSERFDFELELAAVIGRPGRNLAPEDAGAHIAGYVIMNDWTARDLQRVEMARSFGPVKGKDTSTSLGSVFITADELEPRRSLGSFDLRGEVRINDEVFGSDTFDNMAWGFGELVAYASRGAWVRPGDLIASGTCGRGCLAEVWALEGEDAHAPLKAGDLVTTTIEELGMTQNLVVPGDAPIPIGPIAEVRANWS